MPMVRYNESATVVACRKEEIALMKEMCLKSDSEFSSALERLTGAYEATVYGLKLRHEEEFMAFRAQLKVVVCHCRVLDDFLKMGRHFAAMMLLRFDAVQSDAFYPSWLSSIL